jgi:hypothetical protein
MAETSARIMDMVRKEIQKNPSVSSEELFEKAKKVDRGIGSLNVRQFHARYPLQVKRAAANARKGRAGGRAAKKAGAAKKTRGVKRASAQSGAGTAATKGARRGRPPGVKTGAGRGRRARVASAPQTTGAATPAKRRGRPPRTAVATASSGGEPNRDRVRSLLLQFARDIASAEGKADVVDLIGNVDSWVDQVVSAAR